MTLAGGGVKVGQGLRNGLDREVVQDSVDGVRVRGFLEFCEAVQRKGT